MDENAIWSKSELQRRIHEYIRIERGERDQRYIPLISEFNKKLYKNGNRNGATKVTKEANERTEIFFRMLRTEVELGHLEQTQETHSLINKSTLHRTSIYCQCLL